MFTSWKKDRGKVLSRSVESYHGAVGSAGSYHGAVASSGKLTWCGCRYVSGDYRFRNGYNKHNPRKMVKMWAEKEFRNLMRMQDA
eukprot:698227-Rhodomonas_salina.1